MHAKALVPFSVAELVYLDQNISDNLCEVFQIIATSKLERHVTSARS